MLSVGSLRPRLPQPPGQFRALIFLGVLCCLLGLVGCGQVITRATPTPVPTSTPVPLQAPTVRPTATPAPYTPAPTSTPTATPTPIIYVIQRGDTLLDVAIKFGISVQALQDANGITDPRTLQINQELIIPREALTATGTPTATPTPLPFVVENVNLHYTPLGGLWCFGEIHNTTGTDLEQAGVTVILLDAAGKELARVQERIQVELIAPGGRAPFAAHFTAPPQSFASYSVVPWVGVRGYVGSYYRDLEVRDVVGAGERYAMYTLTGRVANVGPEDALGVVVTATLYDALGRVIGVRRGPPEHNVIPRGGETTFSLQFTPTGGPVASFRVQALGRRVVTPWPGATSTASGR